MYLLALTHLLIILLTPLAHALPSFQHPTCAKGVRIISARGTYQAPGLGSLSGLVNRIKTSIPGSEAVGLHYPASMRPTYQISESLGAQNLTRYINYFAEKCPKTRIVLVGYSQGAQVTMDALCGSTSPGFPKTEPLGAELRGIVTAAVVYGDPSHMVGQPYNRGTGRRHGRFHRDVANCDGWKDKIASWCDAGDPYCDDGHNMAVHHSYRGKYNDAALAFVLEKYGGRQDPHGKEHGVSGSRRLLKSGNAA